eukprot:COSAG01_NODE_8087_length_2925_cov_11.000000_2_plen_151_part_00
MHGQLTAMVEERDRMQAVIAKNKQEQAGTADLASGQPSDERGQQPQGGGGGGKDSQAAAATAAATEQKLRQELALLEDAARADADAARAEMEALRRELGEAEERARRLQAEVVRLEGHSSTQLVAAEAALQRAQERERSLEARLAASSSS